MSRRLKAIVTLLLCLLALVAAPVQAAPSPLEKKLVARINDARQAHDLRRLRTAPKLAEGAHGWARHLIRRDKFHHSNLRGHR
jgi:uncharacterized protein YkwD